MSSSAPAGNNTSETVPTAPAFPLANEDEKTPLPAPKAGTTPPPAVASSAKSGAEVDWDDEDEATTVFDKGVEDTARALLHSSPPASGAPMLPSISPGAAAAARAAALVNRPASSMAPAAAFSRGPLPPPPKTMPVASAAPLEAPLGATSSGTFAGAPRTSRGALVAGAIGIAVIGAAAAFALIPRKGSLVVSVAGPGGRVVDSVQIYVDNSKRCDASPCQVAELSRGVHFIKVTAEGYQATAPKAVKVQAGEEAAENVALVRGGDGTGLKVVAEGAGLKLSVDGKDYGPLPQELKDLEPGTHTVRIDGGDRYESFEKSVTVEPDRILTLDPKLKVKKGLATIKAGANAEEARVLLVSGSERRPVPSLPLRVDITSEKPYNIVATKKGYADFTQGIVFEDGQAERTFVVDLTESTNAAPAEPEDRAAPKAAAPRAGAVTAPAAPAAPAAEAPKGPPKAVAGNGTLNLNSIPASSVILDGRPLGKTPKQGVSASPGPHTVVFVHPEMGRKIKSVTVEAGKTAAAVVTFE